MIYSAVQNGTVLAGKAIYTSADGFAYRLPNCEQRFYPFRERQEAHSRVHDPDHWTVGLLPSRVRTKEEIPCVPEAPTLKKEVEVVGSLFTEAEVTVLLGGDDIPVYNEKYVNHCGNNRDETKRTSRVMTRLRAENERRGNTND